MFLEYSNLRFELILANVVTSTHLLIATACAHLLQASRMFLESEPHSETRRLKSLKEKPQIGLYGQAFKCIWWMPRQLKAMKDVVACDKPRGVSKQTLIRGFPNGETHCFRAVPAPEYIGCLERTRGTEISKYPEEKKSTEIPSVATSERGPAQLPSSKQL